MYIFVTHLSTTNIDAPCGCYDSNPTQSTQHKKKHKIHDQFMDSEIH